MKRNRLLFLLALLTAAAGAWAQATATTSATRTGSNNTYTVKMKEGTKDAAKWTIASDGNSTTGDKTEGLTVAPEKEVTLTYSGRLKVKSVTATHDGWDGDLSNIPASLIGSDGHTVIVPDGTTLTGTLDGRRNPYKIVIPAGATVTLDGVSIDGDDNDNCKWAGINCEGDATIILADGKTNEVKGFYWKYPGIHVAEGKTLIIKGESLGTGKLTASSNGQGCGIGGGTDVACGNIDIQGGVITANGGSYSAGIGGNYYGNCGDINISGGIITAKGGSSGCAGIGSAGEYETNYRCGNITISGGTIVAYGNKYAAGIGCGECAGCGDITISGGSVTAYGGKDAAGIGGSCGESYCGDITITSSVSLVSATKGGPNTETSIGKGYHGSGCGTVTIGCELGTDGKPVSGTGTVYYDGHGYQNGGADYLAQSTLTYPNFDLSTLSFNYVVANGTTLTGTFDGYTQPYKITIADGATVTLADVIFKPVDSENTKWAGINCAGDATIIVKDGTINQVFGMYDGYPAIYVPGEANNSNNNKTLTIKGGTAGTGQLTATGIINAAGIGGGKEIDCGNIIIEGGKIIANGTANGGASIGAGRAASCGNITITGGDIFAIGHTNTPGIGSGYDHSTCGKIIISGGTVEAIGGDYAPAIGSGGNFSNCGEILITTGVTQVTASRSIDDTVYCIGPGMNSYCGMVYVGCTLDTNGDPNDDGSLYPDGIGDSPFTYPPSN